MAANLAADGGRVAACVRGRGRRQARRDRYQAHDGHYRAVGREVAPGMPPHDAAVGEVVFGGHGVPDPRSGLGSLAGVVQDVRLAHDSRRRPGRRRTLRPSNARGRFSDPFRRTAGGRAGDAGALRSRRQTPIQSPDRLERATLARTSSAPPAIMMWVAAPTWLSV